MAEFINSTSRRRDICADSAPRMHQRSLRYRTISALVLAVAGAAPMAHAVDYLWDPNHTPATPSGGAGSWDLSSFNWTSDSATDVAWPNSGTDGAIFNGSAGSVTTFAPISANKLTFSTAGYTIADGTGGSLTLSGTTPTIQADADTAISSSLLGSAGLVKSGAGILTLSGNNAYSGNTVLLGGTLKLSGANNRLPTGTTVVLGNNVAGLNTATPSVGNLDLGGTSQTIANLSVSLSYPSTVVGGASPNSFTATIGNGALTLNGTTADQVLNGPAVASNTSFPNIMTLDMSGLTSFTYNSLSGGTAKNFYVRPVTQNSTANPSSQFLVNLSKSGTNTITAGYVQIGAAAGSSTGLNHIATLSLGQTNVINAGTAGYNAVSGLLGSGITLGGFNGRGAINIQSGLSNPTLKLRGTDGASDMPYLIVGMTNSGSRDGSGTLDLLTTGASIDANIGTVIIGQHYAASNGPTPIASLFSIGGGNLNAGAIIIGNKANAGGPILNTTFTQGGGTVTAGTVTMGSDQLNEIISGTVNGTSTYNSTFNLMGGSLKVGTINVQAIPGQTAVPSSQRVIAWSGGTITTRDASTDTTIDGVAEQAATPGTRPAGFVRIVASSGASALNFDAPAGRTITLGQNTTLVGSGITVNKIGTGSLVINSATPVNTTNIGSLSNIVSTSLNITGGTVTLDSASWFGGANLTVGGSTVLNVNGKMGAAGASTLTVGSGVTALTSNGKTAFSGTQSHFVASLTVGAAGQVDVGAGSLDINYGANPTPATAIKGYLAAGYASGAWNGVGGIVSSGAAANPLFALGYYDAAEGATPAVPAGNLLVKYTYAGDANLDGQVDVTDLGALATKWQSSAEWSGGDFNYDGFVDVTDLGKLATNWQAGVPTAAPMTFGQALASVGLGGASVPEPAGIGFVGLALMGLAKRRLRRS